MIYIKGCGDGGVGEVGWWGVYVSCGENCRPGLYVLIILRYFYIILQVSRLSEAVWHHVLRARKLKNVVMLVTCIRKMSGLNLVWDICCTFVGPSRQGQGRVT